MGTGLLLYLKEALSPGQQCSLPALVTMAEMPLAVNCRTQACVTLPAELKAVACVKQSLEAAAGIRHDRQARPAGSTH